MHRAPGTVAAGVALVLALSTVGATCGPSETETEQPQPERQDVCTSAAPPSTPAPTVVLGRSEGATFVELTGGEALPLNFGPQGGQHVYVSVRLYAETAIAYTYQLEVIDDATMARAGANGVTVQACAGEWVESQNVTVFMETGEARTGLLTIDVTAHGESHPSAHAEVPVSITLP